MMSGTKGYPGRTAAVILCILLCVPPACRAREASLYFTGDIIMHRPVKGSAQLHEERDPVTGQTLNNGGYDMRFSRIAPYLAGGDLVMGNMEFPIMPPYASISFVFNGPPVVLQAMKKAGFNAVTIANNHIMDQEPGGVANTMMELDRAGIPFIGAGRNATECCSGRTYRIRDITVGITAATDLINREIPPLKGGLTINRFADPAFVESVRSLRTRCEFLVAVIHGGDEYRTEPSARDLNLYRAVADAGADVIIGHHPHVLQRTDLLQRTGGGTTLVFYSLGNFISNQSGPGTRDSAVVRLFLERQKEKITSRVEILPVATSNTWDPTKGRHRIQAVALDDEYRRAVENLKNAANEKDRQKAEKAIVDIRNQSERIRAAILPAPVEGVSYLEHGR